MLNNCKLSDRTTSPRLPDPLLRNRVVRACTTYPASFLTGLQVQSASIQPIIEQTVQNFAADLPKNVGTLSRALYSRSFGIGRLQIFVPVESRPLSRAFARASLAAPANTAPDQRRRTQPSDARTSLWRVVAIRRTHGLVRVISRVYEGKHPWVI